jgi:hypothetical protein
MAAEEICCVPEKRLLEDALLVCEVEVLPIDGRFCVQRIAVVCFRFKQNRALIDVPITRVAAAMQARPCGCLKRTDRGTTGKKENHFESIQSDFSVESHPLSCRPSSTMRSFEVYPASENTDESVSHLVILRRFAHVVSLSWVCLPGSVCRT